MKYQSGRQPLLAGAAWLPALLLAAFCALPAARADDAALVAEAKADVQRYAGPQTQWLGPTSGPKAEPGKVVVYLSGDEQNDISRQYGVFMKQAAEKIGWKLTIIDGKGSPTSWLARLSTGDLLQTWRRRSTTFTTRPTSWTSTSSSINSIVSVFRLLLESALVIRFQCMIL